MLFQVSNLMQKEIQEELKGILHGIILKIKCCVGHSDLLYIEIQWTCILQMEILEYFHTLMYVYCAHN